MSFKTDLARLLSPSIDAADAQSAGYGAYHPGSGPMAKLALERPDLVPPTPLALDNPNPATRALGGDPMLAAVGNANVGPLFRKPGPSLKDRILEGISGGMAGLAAASPASDTSFLPSLARAYTGTTENIEAGRREAFQRQLQAQMLGRQQTMDQSTLDLNAAHERAYDAAANRPAPRIPTDPYGPEATQAINDRAKYAASLRPAAGALTPDASRTAENDDAEGLAILNSTGTEQQIQGFGRAFQAARRQFPTMSPGRLAKQVYQGLLRVNPSLAPARGGQGGAFGGMPNMTGGAPASAIPDSTFQAPTAQAAPSKPQAMSPADAARAKTDPAFAQWLKTKGYRVP